MDSCGLLYVDIPGSLPVTRLLFYFCAVSLLCISHSSMTFFFAAILDFDSGCSSLHKLKAAISKNDKCIVLSVRSSTATHSFISCSGRPVKLLKVHVFCCCFLLFCFFIEGQVATKMWIGWRSNYENMFKAYLLEVHTYLSFMQNVTFVRILTFLFQLFFLGGGTPCCIIGSILLDHFRLIGR